MRGTLFFTGVGVFALGVLVRTLMTIPWQFITVAFFFAVLSFAFALFEPGGSHRSLFIGFLVLSGVCGVVRTAFAPQTLPEVFLPLINTHISFAGVVVADPDVREKNQQLVVSVYEHGAQTLILVFAPFAQTFVYGERVTISGVLTTPVPFSTDTGRMFRYDHYLAKRGIFSDIPRATVVPISRRSGFIDACADALFSMKHSFVNGLNRALPDPYGELATGLLTGDQHSLSDALITMLSLSGLIWVVVLSGYHVTIIAEGVTRLFAFLPRRHSLAIAGCIVACIVFATGASAPSLRGSIMAGFALFAEGTKRQYNSLRALAATLVIILLWNPLLLAYDQGFELSLIVTPAIIIGMPILEPSLLWIKSKMLREVISVSVIAQLACLPLIVWQEGQLEIWAIPANMLVTAFVPLVMLLAVVAGFTGMIVAATPLASLLGFPAYCLLYFMLAVARISSSLPFAGLTLPPFSFLFVVVAYTLLIGLGWLMKTHMPAPKGAGISKRIISRT